MIGYHDGLGRAFEALLQDDVATGLSYRDETESAQSLDRFFAGDAGELGHPKRSLQEW